MIVYDLLGIPSPIRVCDRARATGRDCEGRMLWSAPDPAHRGRGGLDRFAATLRRESARDILAALAVVPRA